jgi:ATP-binding cassette subfamily B protein
MDIVKKLIGQLKQYKTAALLAPVFTLAAVGLEVLIPYVMALLIDEGIAVGDIGKVFKWGIIMLLCAVLALMVGASSGIFGSEASTGLAANLRDALFEKVQTYSFGNIDKFSTAGLVTRMTTDVTNVQNAFQMVLTIATRAHHACGIAGDVPHHLAEPLGRLLCCHGASWRGAHLYHAQDDAHVWQRV